MATDTNTLFEQLLEYKWKGVSFPTSTFRMILRHDLVPHKYGDTDGANVESTGRAPFQFVASIPFLNGAVPGRGETWGIPYPTQFRAFMAVAQKGTTGIMQHPEFGNITCKLEHCEVVWAATTRDGVHVDCTWLETIDDEAEIIGKQEGSPVSNVLIGATDLDAQITEFNPPLPQLPIFQPDFSETLREITGFSDQISLLQQRSAGQIANVVYRLQNLEASIDKLPPPNLSTVKQIIFPDPTAAARQVLAWPVRMSIEQLRSSLVDLKAQLGTQNSTIAVYVVPQDTTLASVVIDTGADIGDVIKLNPKACASPIVTRGTKIRYYPRTTPLLAA